MGTTWAWKKDVLERAVGKGARATELLVRSTANVVPPANLVHWKVPEERQCNCGQHSMLHHILFAFPFGPERLVYLAAQPSAEDHRNCYWNKCNQEQLGKFSRENAYESRVVFHQGRKQGITKPGMQLIFLTDGNVHLMGGYFGLKAHSNAPLACPS